MRRREFLARSMSVGAAGALVPSVALEAATTGTTPSAGASVHRFSRAWFESLLDQEFQFHQDGRTPTAARLVAVHALPGSDRHEQFSLAFRVASDDTQGGIFEAHHATAGRFPLMVSPCADHGSRLTWQAHFSLLK